MLSIITYNKFLLPKLRK